MRTRISFIRTEIGFQVLLPVIIPATDITDQQIQLQTEVLRLTGKN